MNSKRHNITLVWLFVQVNKNENYNTEIIGNITITSYFKHLPSVERQGMSTN